MNEINIEKIERERVRLKLSKYEMSRRIDMSRQSYYDILNNKSTKLSTLKKIAEVLDFDYKDLLI